MPHFRLLKRSGLRIFLLTRFHLSAISAIRLEIRKNSFPTPLDCYSGFTDPFLIKEFLRELLTIIIITTSYIFEGTNREFQIFGKTFLL